MLKALKVVVDSNVALGSGDDLQIIKLPEGARAAPISQQLAQENVVYLRTQVESWLAVLFNVFSSVGRDSQGPVGDVISTWVAIADEQVSCGRTIRGYNSRYPYRTLPGHITNSSLSSVKTSAQMQLPLRLRAARRIRTTSSP